MAASYQLSIPIRASALLLWVGLTRRVAGVPDQPLTGREPHLAPTPGRNDADTIELLQNTLSINLGVNAAQNVSILRKIDTKLAPESMVHNFKLEMPSYVWVPIVLALGVTSCLVGVTLGLHPPENIVPYAAVVIAVYVSFSVSVDLSIGVQSNGSGYAFNAVCPVIVTEAAKCVISALIYSWRFVTSDKSSTLHAVTFQDVKLLALPAVIFTSNNILMYVAIGSNDMSTFGIFRDTVILWTAAISGLVFHRKLGWIRLRCIAVIFSGIIMEKFFKTKMDGNWSWAFLWILAMTVCNASGSVANEYALKFNRSLDINIQNTVFCACGFVFALIILVFQDPLRYGHFFDGFDQQTWRTIGLHSFGGLVGSRLLKHTDAVMKTVATCLRGPIVVALSPLFTSEDYHVGPLFAAVVTASGCFAYMSQGLIEDKPIDTGSK